MADTSALEAALLRELAAVWSQLNWTHFQSAMKKPVFALDEADGRLGRWDGRSRTLFLGRKLVLEQPWSVVCEVLKHEMAHAFVGEVLGIHDETAHGPAFRDVCARLGIDPAASGLPRPGDAEEDPVLRRTKRLLALAESPNRHEAEAAMVAAQRLLLRHNLDLARTNAERGYAFAHVGTPRRRVEGHEHILAGLLARHFFVETIWVSSYLVATGQSGRVLELAGTPQNLEIAVYVHGYLLETGERLWREHRRATGEPGDRERRRFLLGVMSGFDEKLHAGERAAQKEGLVKVKDAALEEYLRRRHPRQTRGAGVTFRPTKAYESGRQAGRQIVLRKPVGAAAVSRGRLLPGRSS